MPPRRSALVAAANAASTAPTSTPPADAPPTSEPTTTSVPSPSKEPLFLPGNEESDVKPTTLPNVASSSARPGLASETLSSRSTPALSDGSRGSVPPQGPGSGVVPAPKLKFKPKRPLVRREPTDIKPDAAQLNTANRGTPPARAGPSSRGGSTARGGRPEQPSTRGGPSTRGASTRGRGGGRGAKVNTETVGVGIFGSARLQQSQGNARRTVAAAHRMMMPDYEEQYSSGEDDETRRNIVDIDNVWRSGGTAPTSIYRDRRTKEEKAKAKAEKADLKRALQSMKKKKKPRASAVAGDMMDEDIGRVKDEPISPDKLPRRLPVDDDGDVTMDESVGGDAGSRVRAFARNGGVEEAEDEDEEEVNKAQAVDLSESESEEEEEGMEGDFVQIEGGEAPDQKLFMFQFPQSFPQFEPRPIDATNIEDGSNGEKKPDIKPNIDVKPNIQASGPLVGARSKKNQAPPEGRIGTMVVMKSGKVKMILGEDIVMNVTPGVPTSFIQQVVHLDTHKKYTNVLGEIHRSYVVTPDVDRLLSQLYIEGGLTPGDKVRMAREKRMKEMMEMRMVKQEDD